MAENEGNESIQVERMLMKFEDIPNRDRLKLGVFSIEIESVGCWIVKFRKSGVIVNNRDLILSIVPDALIVFKSYASFMRTMDGGSTLNDEVSKGQLSLTGPSEALESFHYKWLRICDLPNTINADIPTRSVRLPSMDKVQPLKAGWLLKKRDIFSGWRCRYFVVYPDRLEYFIDQYDATPKATMSLIDVEVQPVKRVNMPGVGEHWGIIVTTKNPKSTFRLASEMTGIEGMVECSTWEKVFTIARQSCEQYLEDIVSDSEASRQKQRQNEKQTADAARLSVRATSPKGKRSSFGSISNMVSASKAWMTYATSRNGAPRVLLCIASVVLIVRLVWNVTRIQQMLRNMLFHSVVAVLVLVILFFLKSIFTEYFSADDVPETEESSTACMNTIAPCSDATGTSTAVAASSTANTKLSLVPPTATEHKARKRLFNFGNRNKSSTASASAQDNTSKPSAQDNARRAASPLVSRNSSDGPRYGGVSPLPPHIISTKPGIAEHPLNTSTMKNVTNSSDDS